MYKKYPLGKFFLLVLLFVAGLVTFVLYGWRKNAPSNIYQDGEDISAPFYQTPKGAAEGEEHAGTPEGEKNMELKQPSSEGTGNESAEPKADTTHKTDTQGPTHP